MNFDASKAINGTYGEAWCNNIKWNNVKGSQAKIDKKKEEINIAGQMMVGTKTISTTGKGSVTVYKVDSEIIKMELDALNRGIDLKHKLILVLADPNAFGAERIALTGVSFDDITLADWEVAKIGEVEFPFTFEKAELLDYIVAS